MSESIRPATARQHHVSAAASFHSFRDLQAALTCKNASDDGTNPRQEVRERPEQRQTQGFMPIPRKKKPEIIQPLNSVMLAFSVFVSHLCFSVNFTIMGDNSYKTNTPGSPWSPIRPLATFSCLVTENWFVFNTCNRDDKNCRQV